jgi:sec-independent protein translocase protein TatC
VKRKRKTASPSATKLSQHISELRWRFFACLVVFAVGGGITYLFREEVFQLLQLPLDTPLYYTTPAGSFSLIMRFCTIGAVAVVIPMLAYQIIMFIRPAFSASISRLRVYVSSVASLFLAFAGMAFGFGFILPASLHFFAGFQMEGLESIISADSYLSLVTNILVTFALAFQLPLIISFIDHIKPIKPQKLFKMEKWVILVSLVISIFVPFAWDLATSLLIASPIVVLYNIAIIAVLLQHMAAKTRRPRHRAHKVAHVEPVETAPDAPKVAALPAQQHTHVAPSLNVVTKSQAATSRPISKHNTPAPKSMDIMPPTRTAPRIVPPQRSVKLQPIQPIAGDRRLISDILRQPRTT